MRGDEWLGDHIEADVDDEELDEELDDGKDKYGYTEEQWEE